MNCPACGADVLYTQKNCDQCGLALEASQSGGEEQPVADSSGQSGFNPGVSFTDSEYAPRYGGGSGDIAVTPVMLEHLQATRPWVRFMSVMLFISVGLMFLGGLLLMATLASAGRGGPPAAIGLLYWLLGLVYIAPAIFLNRYATSIRELLQGGGASPMEKALESQKSFWRYVGILTVVILCIYALILLIAILAGISSVSR